MYLKIQHCLLIFLVFSTFQTLAQTNKPSLTQHELKFLEHHWGKNPIPLQGLPPANYSPLEASLFPESCGQCHPQQYQDWKTSIHSQAMGPGVLGQLIVMQEEDPETAKKCWFCHTPLAEQQAILKIKDKNSFKKNADFDESLYHQGLVCAACHLRKNQRYGPPRKGQHISEEINAPGMPHNGFIAQTAFTKSAFCKDCHQFAADGYALNGKLLANTYNEWEQSEYASKGIQCQNCHMPDRRHLWRGIHDQEMVKNALKISIIEQPQKLNPGEELKISIKLENIGAGHHFPTYLTPRILIRGYLLDDAQQRIEESLLEASIGREVPLDLSHEIFDTRISANDFVVVDYQQLLDDYSHSIKIEVIVQPDYFYEKFYRSMLENNSAGKGKKLIEEAWKNASSSEYLLFDKTITINRTTPKKAINKKPFSLSGSPIVNTKVSVDWNENSIQWYSYNEGLQEAKETNKPIMLILYADWCPTCHAYKKIFYRNDILKASKNMIMIRINVDEYPILSESFDADGNYVPRTFLLDSAGNRLNMEDFVTHKFKHFIQDNEPMVFLKIFERAASL